jgi:CPA2 family monovalent cation:H+ antiporter-2
VLVGYGRVGALVGAELKASGGRPLLVFEDGAAAAEAARRDGAEVVAGNAADPEVLRAANLGAARRLVVAIPEAFEAGQVVEQARAANPALRIVARAHSEGAAAHLSRLGADLIVSGEREIARRILEDVQGEPGTTGDPDARPEQGGPPAPAPARAAAAVDGGAGRAVEPSGPPRGEDGNAPRGWTEAEPH